MGIVGGEVAYRFLKRYYPGGTGVPMSEDDPFKANGISKLKLYFGPDIFRQLANRTVIDFGCGEGGNAIELAANGCRRVVGVDIQEHLLEKGRAEAARLGLSDKVTFTTKPTHKADVILSTDAFEHFDDPAGVLRIMRGLLKDDGYALVEFGCTWYHPLGGHLFSVFPWAHLVFTEKSLMRWRSEFKSDGAMQFYEVAGGLNQMTLRRWERLVGESDFQFSSYKLKPIRAARRLHCALTRELLTSTIYSKLIPK